jgi:uncharacterized Ntn-hydrolase superfamily protein
VALGNVLAGQVVDRMAAGLRAVCGSLDERLLRMLEAGRDAARRAAVS